MPLDLIPDRDVVLADWGRVVVHESVQIAYDPATQTTTEVRTATEVTGIVDELAAEVAQGTNGTVQIERRSLVVAVEDWPRLPEGAVRRVSIDGGEYDVIETHTADLPRALLIHLRRRGVS
jgi:hypothetical protein